MKKLLCFKRIAFMTLKKKNVKDRTEVVFKGRSPRVFLVPNELAKNLLGIIKKFEIKVSKDKIFAEFDKKYVRPELCLKEARMNNGLTQFQLAKKLGVHQANISAMETGVRPIGKEMAKRLGKILGVGYRVFL